VQVRSSLLGNAVVATTTQPTSPEQPSTADSYLNASYFEPSYTSDGYLDNEVTYRANNSQYYNYGYLAAEKNAVLYWRVNNINIPAAAGTVTRNTTGAIRSQSATVGEVGTDRVYVDLVRPTGSAIAAVVSGTGTYNVYLTTKSADGTFANLLDTYLVFDGTTDTVIGRFGATVSLGTPNLSNAASGAWYAPTVNTPLGVTEAYSIRVQVPVNSNIDYASNLSFDVYRYDDSSDITTPLLGIPYASGYHDTWNGNWNYNDTVGETNLGNYYDYYVVARSTLFASDNVIATSNQSSSWTQLSTPAALSTFGFEYTDQGVLDNEVTLKIAANSNGDGFKANSKNAKLYWVLTNNGGSTVSTAVPINGTIARSNAVRGTSGTVGALVVNDLYIDLERPTSVQLSAARDLFSDVGASGTEQTLDIYIATKDANGDFTNVKDTNLNYHYDGTGTGDGDFVVEGRFGANVTLGDTYVTNSPNGSYATPIGVTGAYSIASYVYLSNADDGSSAVRNSLIFDIYRNGLSLATSVPSTSGTFSGNYWYYNDVVGEANLGTSYRYRIVARSNLITGDNVIAESTQSGVAIPSSAFTALYNYGTSAYASGGSGVNAVTYKIQNMYGYTSIATANNAVVYWYVNGTTVPIGSLTRANSARTPAIATGGILAVGDYYIDIVARPDETAFKGAFTGVNTYPVYLATKDTSGTMQTLRLSGFSISFNGNAAKDDADFTLVGTTWN
jgi:hypothetical protein